ncbi:MAG: hypothetical protein J1F09_00875 [Oscillospiraceae bacterium]|nr:hypothetical protein [Oscillospiraceae bacterium]
MLEYCVCPKCERMIMLDSDFDSGFCCVCGTHISYDEAREELLSGLRASIPDELTIAPGLSGLIEYSGDGEYMTEYSEGEDYYAAADYSEPQIYGLSECREECAKGSEFLGKWDFSSAFKAFSKALDWYPADFESRCGLMVSGILRLKDTENWERYLSECIEQIRSQSDWNMAGAALEYTLDILKKFLSKGGRYVSPSYTIGFFERLVRSFPAQKQTAAEILAHCLNIENAPLTDAARLDHETTRFAVGSCPNEPDKNLRRGMLLIMRCHCDARVKESLCRALYVYDRVVWLRAKDAVRINDAVDLCEEITNGEFPPADVKIVINTIYDFLMMGALEQNSTEREKLLFLSNVYSFEQIRRMERFFGGKIFFNKLYAEIYLKQKGASLISPEYKRIQAKIIQLSE